MTDGHKWFILVTLGLIAFGWSAFLWNKYSPPTIQLTPQEQHASVYYDCVRDKFTNAEDPGQCNSIQLQ